MICLFCGISSGCRPLVRAAGGYVAACAGIAVNGAVAIALGLGLIHQGVPLLTLLGPVIVVEDELCRRRGQRVRPVFPEATIRLARTVDATEWVAVLAWHVVAWAATPGLARRAAREAGYRELPVVYRADP